MAGHLHSAAISDRYLSPEPDPSKPKRMTRPGRYLGAALFALALVPWTTASAQGDCLNEDIFPSGAITPDAFGDTTIISACSFETEYSHITGIQATGAYQFTLSSGGYITVRQGTYDGTVLAQGFSPVTATATDAQDLFVHWNVDDNCATASTCMETTVQLLLDCEHPVATYAFTEDCDLGGYYIDVDITSTGDGPTVDLIVTQGGFPSVTEDLGIGVIQLGPFFYGDQPSVSVAHATDPLCTLNFGVLEPFPSCPIAVQCGLGAPAVPQAYCYGNDQVRSWHYQGAGTGTMRLRFLVGTIASSFGDSLRVYDGSDATGTLLFEHTTEAFTDLSELVVYGTSGSLFMELTTDGFTSCEDGSFDESQWEWEVGCSDCTVPAGTATFATDCPTETFTVTVDITSLGNGPTATLNYVLNGDPQQLAGLPLGETVLGPFQHGDSVSVVLQHAFNNFCEVDLGSFADPGLCPNLIQCGVAPEELTYCYTPNDARTWRYQSVGAGTLRLTFIRGTIESNTFDDLRIYDGPDNTAPLVFEHNVAVRRHLGPVGSATTDPDPTYYAIDIFATGTDLFMEMSSDGSVDCGSNSADYDAWEWEVVCFDCTLPEVTYTVVDDCANDQFSIPITVASTGDGSIVNIVYIVNDSEPQIVSNVGVGVAEIGPFALNDTVNVVVEHADDFLCNIELGDITDTGTCPLLIDCGTEVSDSTCYGNFNDLRYYYQGTGTFPLGLFFESGELFFGDSVLVYDGGNIDAPLLFQGTEQDMTGEFMYTTNPEHRLTIRIKANGFTSCEDGSTEDLVAWRIACLDCVPASAEFNIVQDCDNFQYFIDVVISDIGSDAEAQITTTATQDTLEVTAAGTYQIGPFVSGTELEVTIVNDANSLCNVYSGNMVNPLCPDIIECPGPTLEETYCYVPNDVQAWAYELQGAGGNATLRLTFTQGTIESNTFDDLTIYDGPDNTSPILFQHDQAARRHLGPEGSATTDAAPVYYAVDVAATGTNLYMEMSSDGSVDCGSGSLDYDQWEWEVYCLDCANPTATFNIVEDCFNREYTTEVIVTNAGGDDDLTITNLETGESLTGLGVGVHTFGPFPLDSVTILDVANELYEQCQVVSDSLILTAAECISVTCGFDNYTYCYENNEDRWYTFQSAENVPITIAFLGGQMLAGDRIILYNGPNELSPVLYQGNNGGNLAGFAINSANTDNVLTMRIQSNEAGSCDDGQVTNPLSWTVACGAVGVRELPVDGFAVYPNPTNGLLTIQLGQPVVGNMQVRVLDMSGRVVIDQPLTMVGGNQNTIDMRGLQSGNYLVQLTTAQWVKTQRVEVAR